MLNDNEIMKALECCQYDGMCEYCYLKSDKRGCKDRLHKDAFDLILKLQAHITKCETVEKRADVLIAQLQKELKTAKSAAVKEGIDNLVKEMG